MLITQCGLNEVKHSQIQSKEYQINIVSKEHQNSIIYVRPDRQNRYLLYAHHNHYDLINSMAALVC